MEISLTEIKDVEKKLLPLINDQSNVYNVKKSIRSSANIRNEGINLYNLEHHDKKIHLDMLKCYTKSIAYAPSGSEDLALGYDSRSILLFHLGQYKSCITDVNRALAITRWKCLKIKLLVRKAECIALGKLYLHDEYKSLDVRKVLKEAEDLLESDGNSVRVNDYLHMLVKNAVKSINKFYDKKTDGRENNVSGTMKFPDFDTKGEISYVSDAAALRYNDDFGRHLIATRDVKPGEILTIENGFVYPSPFNAYMTCSHCVEGTFNGIPCDGCVFAIYCSERCKQDAWASYHDKECSNYDYYKILEKCTKLDTFGFDFDSLINSLMLLRRMLIITIKNINVKSVDNLYSKFFGVGLNQSKRTTGFKINDEFNGRTLEAVGSLLSHFDEKASDLKLLPFVYMLSIDVLPFESESDFRKMLHLVTQAMHKINTNSFSVGLYDDSCGCETDNGNGHQGNCITTRGAMLVPFCSLVNHSCVNNAEFAIVNGKMVLFSRRPIKAGEQIFISYGLATLQCKPSHRQHILFCSFYFTCNCQACKENWPVITEEELIKGAEAGLSEFRRQMENIGKLDPDELKSRFKQDIKNDFWDSKSVELPFLLKANKNLYVTSETLCSLFKNNTFRDFIIKSATVRYKLRLYILRDVFGYDENHFNVSRTCS